MTANEQVVGGGRFDTTVEGFGVNPFQRARQARCVARASVQHRYRPHMTASPVEGLTYANVRMGLRAPRVAIIFRAGPDWDYWARCALHYATKCWGGQGFILVPHIDGEVAEPLLRAVRAYDPDYVLAARITIEQWEMANPGELGFTGEQLSQFGSQAMSDPSGDRARLTVANACSSYRFTLPSDSDAAADEEEWIGLERSAGRHITLAEQLPGYQDKAVLTTPADLRGAAGLSLAAQVGCSVPPAVAQADSSPPPVREPWLLSPDVNGYLRRRYRDTTEAANTLPTAFELSNLGLGWVTAGHLYPRTLTVVAGETADDFSLALAIDRLYGRALWLHPDWYPRAVKGIDKLDLQHELASPSEAQQILVTSVSLPADRLQAVIDEILTLPPSIIITDVDGNPVQPGRQGPPIEVGEPAWPRSGKRHLGVTEQFDMAAALPAYRTADGGLRLAAPPPIPRVRSEAIVPPQAMLPSEGPHWQVDLEILPAVMPRARRVPRTSLVTGEAELSFAWMRSGRNGVSYEPWSFGFVPAGATIDQQLIRPLVRELGLPEWAAAVAELSKCTVRPSAAGMLAKLLATKWGSREAMVDDLATPVRKALRDMHPSGTTTSGCYPQHDGVRLRSGYGVLSFRGFARHWPSGTAASNVRELLDRLTHYGVVRRGLVLGCQECHEVDFVSVDDLAQANRCMRCGAASQLTRSSWKVPEDEPTWFYDAHPSLRSFVSQFGDAPLLLSHALRTSAKQYSDCAEFELLDGDGPKAEVDLFAHVDDAVIVAEVKSANAAQGAARLGKGSESRAKAAAKRVTSARILRADQIVLATTQTAWEPASLNAISVAVEQAVWDVSAKPVVRIITGLGTQAPTDQAL